MIKSTCRRIKKIGSLGGDMLFPINQRHLVLYFALFLALPADAFETDIYGSLRLQAEYVEPDNEPGNFDDYAALRDAYTRVGLKVSHSFTPDWLALFQIELPIDLVNKKLRHSWGQDEDIRIFNLKVSGPLGSLSYGRDWTAFYNKIAYPVDYFPSFYSGFTSFTSFRLDDTLAYTSPSFNGIQFSASTSKDNGTRDGNREQYTVSYTNNILTLAAGIDALGGDDNVKILGLAASFNKGPWYLAATYEQFDSDISGHGWAADGTDAINAFAQYTIGNDELRILLANVDNYGEFVFHAGWELHYNDNTSLFVEYYQEQETAVISDAKQTTSSARNFDPADSGGRSLLIGIRYDF
ncbi:MAG: porin [Gammaproteobacteria bacterium]|nr:MAG: porin [Gammaproteobacteria bacterium]